MAPAKDSVKFMNPALQISELSFAYPGGVNALEEVNLEAMPGERLGLIGPNGAGKTTLFLAICGLLEPSAGQITALGKPIKHRDFRPDIGLVFQNPDDQLFCPSVLEDVAFGLRNMGLPKGEVNRRATEALSLVGHPDLSGRPVHQLSEGEKRMVSIAGVLAMHPQLVLHDEPSANLDLRSRRRLIKLLQSSSDTMLVASHDLELILELCNRVVLMDRGRIVADGDPRQIMGDSELMEAHGQEKPHSLVPHAIEHEPFNYKSMSD
jgi:cobalt/nickel transport system ATP-binding protein